MTDHELNIEIARMMPGWVEYNNTAVNEPLQFPAFTVIGEGRAVAVFRTEDAYNDCDHEAEYWTPTTDLNQAAEAVREIIGIEAKDVSMMDVQNYSARAAKQTLFIDSLSNDLGSRRGDLAEVAYLLAGPRAWCEALVAIGGDRET